MDDIGTRSDSPIKMTVHFSDFFLFHPELFRNSIHESDIIQTKTKQKNLDYVFVRPIRNRPNRQS
jgi:hypothetical protein